jgi:hypothetical protein
MGSRSALLLSCVLVIATACGGGGAGGAGKGGTTAGGGKGRPGVGTGTGTGAGSQSDAVAGGGSGLAVGGAPCPTPGCVYHPGAAAYFTCLSGGAGTCFHQGARAGRGLYPRQRLRVQPRGSTSPRVRGLVRRHLYPLGRNLRSVA